MYSELCGAAKCVEWPALVGHWLYLALMLLELGQWLAARVTFRTAATAASAVGTVAVAFETLLISIDIATMAKAAYNIHKYDGGKGVSNSKISKKAREKLEMIRQHIKHMQCKTYHLQYRNY